MKVSEHSAAISFLLHAGVIIGALSSGACCNKAQPPAPLQSSRSAASGPSRVWVVDDGHRIARHSGPQAAMDGSAEEIWQPGGAIRLHALAGETVAFQVVVTAGKADLREVRVELDELKGPTVLRNSPTDAPTRFQPIERFVVHELDITRRSGGRTPRESLGWTGSHQPPDPSFGGSLPDPLIPVEVAPTWADYPMTVKAGEHRVVWLDITIPNEGAPAGDYTGTLQITSDAGALAKLPLELRVGSHLLPYAPVKTMVFFEPDDEVIARTHTASAVRHYQQLMHRHQLSTIMPIRSASDVKRWSDAITGTLYTSSNGYEGPGAHEGSDVVAIGAYGILGEPSVEKLGPLREILETLQALGMVDTPGKRDIFLYAVDEQCDSPRSRDWKRLLAGQSGLLKTLRVGHTCSEPPVGQAADIVMMLAGSYSAEAASQALSRNQRVWIYNGVLPSTGSYLTDAPFLSLRTNAWLQAGLGIERWFYWESTFWNDNNRGGLGPYDPLQQAETFHNQEQDHANGDGVLVYPGTQSAGRNLEFTGVIPSMRLKQWRRGILDTGYIELARQRDPQAVEQIVARLIPPNRGGKPSWEADSTDYLRARIELFRIIED